MIIISQGAGTYAAQLCADLDLNDYNDWYLPSKDELNMLYLNKAAVGGFVAFHYWGSSEIENNMTLAVAQDFNGGYQFTPDKSQLFRVRAIRAF